MAIAVKVELKEMEEERQAVRNQYLQLVKEADHICILLNSKSEEVLA